MDNTIPEFLKEYFFKPSIFYTEYTVYLAVSTINTTDFKVFRTNIEIRNNIGTRNRKSEQKERLYNTEHKKRECTKNRKSYTNKTIYNKKTDIINNTKK